MKSDSIGLLLHRELPILIVGIVFLLYTVLWFKQYTYFNFSGSTVYFDDEELITYASTAEEKDFELSKDYPEKISRIIFWVTQYSDIYLVNDSDQPVEYTVSDYYGDDVDAMPDAVILQSGEEVQFVADERNGYVVTAYGKAGQGADGLSVTFENSAYMGRWKKATYVLLAVMVFWLALICVTALFNNGKIWDIGAWISLSGAAIILIILEIVRIENPEPWIVIIPSMGAMYLAALSVVAAVRKNIEKTVRIEMVKCPYLAAVMSLTAAIFLHFLMLTSREGTFFWRFNGITDSNKRIWGYVIVVTFFGLLYLCLGNIRIPSTWIMIVDSFFGSKHVLFAVLLILYALWRQNYSFSLSLVAVFVLLIVWGKKMKDLPMPKVFWWIYYAIIMVLVACNHCVINYWDTGNSADVNHTGLVYQSLYFVANNKPFYGGMMELYGHYALFYKLPMMIFGNNMRTIGVTTAVFAGVAAFFALMSVHKMVKHDLSRVIGGVVVLNCFVIDWLYLQTFPIRILWSFILLYYVLRIRDKQLTFWERIWGYLICVAALIWNFESGIVCAVAWAVTVALMEQNEVRLSVTIRKVCREILFVALELLVAYTTVKTYNICMMTDRGYLSEFMDWKKELGFSDLRSVDSSNGSLHWRNEPWLYIEIILMGTAAVLLKKIGLFSGKEKNSQAKPILFLVAFGLGINVYWMNRPEEYNIIMPYIGMVLLIVFDRLLNMDKNDFKYQLKKELYPVALSCAVLGISSMFIGIPKTILTTRDNIFNKHIADYTIFIEHLNDFKSIVPEGTYGEARGLRMIYLSLGWEMDNEGWGGTIGRRNIKENAEGVEWILSAKTTVEGFSEYKEIPFGTYTYHLYKKQSDCWPGH